MAEPALVRRAKKELRPAEQVVEHFRVETELADRLRRATRDERRTLYAPLYDELYRRLPHHSMLQRKATAAEQRELVDRRFRLLQRYLRPDSTYLEIGCGDGALALRAAEHVRQVYALEVSEEIVGGLQPPPNMEILITDGFTVPVPAEGVDVAYSDAVIEHLHPEDAAEQLRSIYRVLKPGGVYICLTCNRLNGPHDVSRSFGTVATGFHMREYTITELSEFMREAGFRHVRKMLGLKRFFLPVHPLLVEGSERALAALPPAWLLELREHPVLDWWLDVRVVATK